MWRRRVAEAPRSAHHRRVSRLTERELLNWVDPTVFELGRALSQWERRRHDGLLNEAAEAVKVLDAIVTELINRASH